MTVPAMYCVKVLQKPSSKLPFLPGVPGSGPVLWALALNRLRRTPGPRLLTTVRITFAFTGTLIRVMVDVSEATFEDLAAQHEAQARLAMAKQ